MIPHPDPPRTSHLARMRSLARTRRRLLPALLLGAPLALVWLTDTLVRGRRFESFQITDVATYLLASVESLLLWSSLLLLASRRRGIVAYAAAILLVVLAALVLGGQLYFFDQYAVYMTVDAAAFGVSVRSSVWNQLSADLGNFALHIAPPAIVAVALTILARRTLRPSRSTARRAALVAPAAIALALMLPCSYRRAQACTPDVLFLHALGRVFAARAGLSPNPWIPPATRKPEFVPEIVARPARTRNVVLVISESQRADVVCSAYRPDCDLSPAMNDAVPHRIALSQLRSNASTTAISLAVLWSGMSPVDTDAVLKSAPLLWSYARAGGYRTAYVTSQNLDFANARGFIADLPLDRLHDALDLDPHADIDIGAPDELATRQALADLAELGEPFFAVVHYSNTHFPYRVDPAHAPFQPATTSKDPARNHEFFNHYKNANYLTDIAVGALLRGIRSAPYGPRTVVLFTSDHGEAFREHDQLGHTGSVYDEEIHVPGWVDAPDGTLDDTERQALSRASSAFTFHVDFAPTVLDLLGLWDAPEIKRFRSRMLGTSLLRDVTRDAVPLTNCAAFWTCPFRNWGVMRQRHKLEARAWDLSWHCFDVAADPFEKHDLGPEACGDLTSIALRQLGRHPHDPF